MLIYVDIEMMGLPQTTFELFSNGSQDIPSLRGASPSRVPRLPAPGDPRATPRSPGQRATVGQRPALEPEEAQPCQQMAQLLATFTKRFLVIGWEVG